MRSSTKENKKNKKGGSIQQPIELNGYVNRHENVKENCIIITNEHPSDYTNLSLTEIHEDAPLLVQRGFVDYYDILQNEFFTIDRLEQKHGDEEIDCRIQHPSFFGFGDGNHLSEQHQKTVLLKDYVEYQRESLKNSPRLKVLKQKFGLVGKYEDFILFGVNIDMKKETWQNELHELKHKVPEEYTWLSRLDLMSYMTQDIPGVTIPQIYMKVKGTWTGGHQENLGARAININFGPGSSEWVSLSCDQVDNFRQYAKKKYNMDVIKDTGYWYADYNELEENGFRPQYCIQKQGDIVILGPSTLHWVRSLSDYHSVQVAWNFVRKNTLDFQEIFNRYNLNQEIKFETVIPMKNWLVHTIAHNFEWLTTVSKNITKDILKYIEQWLKEELKFRDDIYPKLLNNLIEYQNSPKILLCEKLECKQEIFMHYGKCHYQHPKKYQNASILCPKCCLEHVNQLKCYKINICNRYRIEQIKKFQNTLYRILDDKPSADLIFKEGICCGNDYIGETIHDISPDNLYQFQYQQKQNYLQKKELMQSQDRCLENFSQQEQQQIQEQSLKQKQQQIKIGQIQVLNEHQDEPQQIQVEQNPEYAQNEDIVMEEINGNRKKSRPFKKQIDDKQQFQEKKAQTRSQRCSIILESDDEQIATQQQATNSQQQVVISQQEIIPETEQINDTEVKKKKSGRPAGKAQQSQKASSIQSHRTTDTQFNEESKECVPKKKRLNLLYDQQQMQQKQVPEKSTKDGLFDNQDENEDFKIQKKTKKESKNNNINILNSQSPKKNNPDSGGFPTLIEDPEHSHARVKIENQDYN